MFSVVKYDDNEFVGDPLPQRRKDQVIHNAGEKSAIDDLLCHSNISSMFCRRVSRVAINSHAYFPYSLNSSSLPLVLPIHPLFS